MVLGAYKLIEMVDRSKSGPPCSLEEFDVKMLPRKIRELTKEYDLRYDPKQLVHFDSSFIDDVYNAGRDLLLDIGVLCMDTNRLIKFTEEELKESLEVLHKEVSVGAGIDARKLFSRNIEDRRPPSVLGGPAGGILSPGQPYVDAITSIIMEPIVDLACVGSLREIEGRPIITRSPLEIHAAKCEAAWMRTAAVRAGRPGIHLLGSSPEWAASEIAASDPKVGYRPTDGRGAALLTSLKTDYNTLSKVRHYIDYHTFIYTYFTDFIGGFTGGPEGNAISSVASLLANMLVHQPTYQAISVCHIKYVNTTNRMSIWAQNVAGQAIIKNTSIITYLTLTTSSGPCTDMILYEIAASALGVSGGPNVMGVLATSSKELDHYTGLETRFMGEVGHAAAGMKRVDANEVVQEVLKRYENRLEKPQLGKTLQECYDLHKMKPAEEWLNIYTGVKKDLENIGLRFK